jgi:NarL family two-component system response regulator LiaR
VVDALKVGTMGFLSKTTSIKELSAAIHAAHAGKPALSPQALNALIHASQLAPAPSYSLSTREIDVLKLMTKGLNNAEIADQLIISQSTVKFHVSSILSKLGVRTRTEAATLALQQHLC